MPEQQGPAPGRSALEGRARSRYRLLLGIFPRQFRQRWGTDMEAVLLYRLRSAGGGRLARISAWSGVIWDALVGASREWGVHLLGGGPARRAAQRKDGEGMIGSLLQDVRYGVRGLRGAPGASLIAVLTLALGIGANTATFTVIDGILLEPLPYEQPDRIVSVWPAGNFNQALVREVAAQVPALERVAGISVWTAVLTGAGEPLVLVVGGGSPGGVSFLRV
jgi:hypothetical protein